MADKVSQQKGLQSKKSTKHLLERQRRARINKSLSELKHLVLSAIQKGDPQAQLNGTEKMEKAEILELTVNYIKAIKGHTNPGVVWNIEESFVRKRGVNEYQCYGDADKRNKVKKAKRSASQSYYEAYRAGPSSPVNCHIAQCNPCLDCKALCSCYGLAMYGTTTPPPSPSLSIECPATYDDRSERRGVSMTASVPSNMAVQVWRPWVK